MKHSLFIKLAWINLKKNARLYVPDILSGSGLFAVFYILLTLSMDSRFREIRGGMYVSQILPLGVIVVGIMSLILILYTGSFLMKQRYHEFGLYNVLGMEKRHISRICFYENLFSTLMILSAGLLVGSLLYKLCALIISRLIHIDSVLGAFHLDTKCILISLILFLIFYGISYLISLIRIAKMKPVEMLSSSHTGEKEPRVRWILLLIGLISLGSGYYISLTTKDPISAISLFFAAVLLVILGTYCLFVAGSIFFLKLLKNNKAYYYHPKHMIAVSGLLYRMKANAVGLASISILATMVLVMVSTTVSMYAGMDQTIKDQFARDVYFQASCTDENGQDASLPEDIMQKLAEDAASENGLTVLDPHFQHYFNCSYIRSDSVLSSSYDDSGTLGMYFFLTKDEYLSLTGDTLDLSEGEVALFTFPSNRGSVIPDHFTIDGIPFTVKSSLSSFPVTSEYSIVDCYGVVFAAAEEYEEVYTQQQKNYGDFASSYSTVMAFDLSDPEKAGEVYAEFTEALYHQFMEYIHSLNIPEDASFGNSSTVNTVWEMTDYYMGLIGSMLFLGLLLSIVFLFATALIIYYKQISEGYQDRQRFQIMQKVGMTDDEVKGAIRSQVVLIFFLPLAAAALHTCFAFPMLTKLVSIIFRSPTTLFLICSVIALAFFALIYTIIYSCTTRVYYRIVR